MAKRGNNEGSILQRSNGLWMGKIAIGRNVDGKPNRISVYGKSRNEVSRKLIELAYQANHGTYTLPNNLNLGRWLHHWLKDYKSINLKPRTYDTYETQMNVHIIPELGHIELQDLKTIMIQQFINKLHNAGNGLSSATIRKIHCIIQAAMNQAITNGLIQKNPATGVELPRLEQRKIRAFTQEEQDAFFKCACDAAMQPAFLVAVDTGLRMGELLALTWNDIDLKKRLIDVNKNIMYIKNRETRAKVKNKLIVQSTPKTEASTRKIPMTEKVYITLMKLKVKSSPDCCLVFATSKGTHYNPRNFERAFMKVVENAGLEHCNSHTLRHTFATRCFEHGVPVKIVSKWLGHSKISHTLDIYTHVMPELENQAIKMLESQQQTVFQAKQP